MNIWEALSNLQKHQMLEGIAKDNEYVQEVYIRWFNGNLYYCEYDGFPTEKFDADIQTLKLYDWSYINLPEYTYVYFKQAYDWLNFGGEIELEIDDKIVAFNSKNLDEKLTWRKIFEGEWRIKN
ncbi:hypothetical protein EDM57_04485 [Brevibacillus gelatini]|uniref:Uncharacterized protein n=1 Tax=Brevibacillus gelatini TaxID=1655277 RepID=A0A3M8B7I2_9BACL|nr:hypothetical protein [Brevibacillus gelatini]RNB59404.1 hypothetical protein EDM57_04485 [Brevibacillus gelatini]